MSKAIQQLLNNKGLSYIELDTPYESTFGNITGVSHESFKTEDGETYDLSDLEDYDLANLLYDLEMQVEGNEKIFQKATDF
ncbi:MAG: hypothetical protein LBQ74_20150 [Prevotella sp.]|jgi:hypothetical protein|nr:hypothetical protein [Prevotella sp.]